MKVLWLWLWLATEWNDELGARRARGSSRQPALVNRALGDSRWHVGAIFMAAEVWATVLHGQRVDETVGGGDAPGPCLQYAPAELTRMYLGICPHPGREGATTRWR